MNNFEVLITNDMNRNSYYQIHSLITLSPIDERGTPPEFFRAGGRRDTGLTGSHDHLTTGLGARGGIEFKAAKMNELREGSRDSWHFVTDHV